MPYAKIDGAYKIATMRFTDAEFAARRARDSEALLQEMFAEGIYDSAKGERRTDWATAATRLPADGGDAGKAFVRQTTAMAAAVDAKDPDAAMRSGGRWAKMVFADKDYDGKSIAADQRKRKLEVQSLRMLREMMNAEQHATRAYEVARLFLRISDPARAATELKALAARTPLVGSDAELQTLVDKMASKDGQVSDWVGLAMLIVRQSRERSVDDRDVALRVSLSLDAEPRSLLLISYRPSAGCQYLLLRCARPGPLCGLQRV